MFHYNTVPLPKTGSKSKVTTTYSQFPIKKEKKSYKLIDRSKKNPKQKKYHALIHISKKRNTIIGIIDIDDKRRRRRKTNNIL